MFFHSLHTGVFFLQFFLPMLYSLRTKSILYITNLKSVRYQPLHRLFSCNLESFWYVYKELLSKAFIRLILISPVFGLAIFYLQLFLLLVFLWWMCFIAFFAVSFSADFQVGGLFFTFFKNGISWEKSSSFLNMTPRLIYWAGHFFLPFKIVLIL